MKPLSIFTYYLNNKRKVIPLISIISLSILGITATAAFTGAINKDIESQFKLFEHYFTVEVPQDDSSVNVELIQKEIEEESVVDQIFEGRLLSTRVDAILGSSFAYVYALDQQNIQPFLQELDLTLLEGRSPSNDEEIAVSETLLHSKNIAIGDLIGSDIDSDDLLAGTYTVVGVLDTKKPYNIGVTQISNVARRELGVEVLFVHPIIGNEQELDTKMTSLEEDFPSIVVRTYNSTQSQMQEEFRMLDLILWAINVVTILVIALSIALINIIFFMQRANEFGLLSALGYSRIRIISKTLLESAGMVFIGWVVGIFFAEIVYRIANAVMFDQAAYGLTVFELRTILFSLPVPIAVIVFSTATVLWKLTRLDPIAIIEKRD